MLFRNPVKTICFLFLLSTPFLVTACSEGPSTDKVLVRIETRDIRNSDNWLFMGSGVLIEKASDKRRKGISIAGNQKKYSVATAAHVLPLPNEFRVVTHDSKAYEFSAENIIKSLDAKCSDIAVFSFASKRNYEVARINSASLEEDAPVQMHGWFIPRDSSYSELGISNSDRQIVDGEIIDSKMNQKGCAQIQYKKVNGDMPEQGTSGAPIFNEGFEVVGIHVGSNPRNRLLGTPIRDIDAIGRP